MSPFTAVSYWSTRDTSFHLVKKEDMGIHFSFIGAMGADIHIPNSNLYVPFSITYNGPELIGRLMQNSPVSIDHVSLNIGIATTF